MKSLFNFLKSRQKEIELLRNENKLLKDAVSPFISLGIPLEKLAEVLRPIARNLKSELERKRSSASYHGYGSSSPAVNRG